MKKKILLLLCTLALALAFPAAAFADGSPTQKTIEEAAEIPGGPSAEITVVVPAGFTGWLVLEGNNSRVATLAENLPSNIVTLGTFRSYPVESYYSDYGVVTLTLYVGEEYNGAVAYLYVDYSNDETQVAESLVESAVVKDGKITITTHLGWYTVAVDVDTIPSGDDPSKPGKVIDKSSTSPKTGSSMPLVAGVTCAALLVAGGCAVLLRKRAA